MTIALAVHRKFPWDKVAPYAVAQFLVAMALAVGHERAIHASHAALGDSGLADVLPFLQPTVLDRETVRDVGEEDWSLKELRQFAADVVGSEPPELAKIRRVTPGGVAKLVLAALLVSGLVGAFAGVDFQEVLDELRSANVWLLLAALALSPVVQLGQALSTVGAPCVAQRVWAMPTSPCSGSASSSRLRFSSFPSARRRSNAPSCTVQMPALS